MIEIEKSDFLYKHLTKLGVDDIDNIYQEYAENGVTNIKDFKAYLYSKYAETVDKEIEEETLEEILPYFQDIKKVKKVPLKNIKILLKNYKETKDNETFELIVNSKLKDLLFIACLYHLKYDKIEIADIIQTCSLGLMKAVEKYNEKTKIAFDDYIDFWVNIEMENTYTKENK